MITTIQINSDVKKAMDKMKSNKETYEQLIVSLMQTVENEKRNQEDLLIEGCREMYDDMLEIAKEWEGTLLDGLDKTERWDDL